VPPVFHSARRRSTAALVLTRPDSAPPAARAVDADLPHMEGRPWPLWFALSTAVILAVLVTALWAALLLGDSLSG